MIYTIEKHWTTKVGYEASAIFINGSYRTGYVAVPKEHSFFGKDYNNLGFSLDVHGGLTYSGGDGLYPIEYDKEKLWWFGFDCMHFGDLRLGRYYSAGSHRSLEYIENECESLAEQLKKYEVPMTAPQDRTLDEILEQELKAANFKNDTRSLRYLGAIKATLSQLDVVYTAYYEATGNSLEEMRADFNEELKRRLE